MDYKALLLFLAAILNLIMSLIIIRRGWKNPINKYFSLMTFFNILWAGGLLLFRLSNNYEVVRFSASFIYFASLLVVLNLFYFTIHFPFKNVNLNDYFKKILSFIFYVASLYFLFFYQKFSLSVKINYLNTVVYEPIAYLIFTIVLSILMLLAIVHLWLKYLKADKIFKRSIFLVLLGVIVGVAAGSYFNLYAMYFDEFRFYYLGPLFTLAINFVAFYLIFLKKDKKLEY
ncbi:hypothetical protein H6761_02115 [Candidatus Nomurabacteria bacterium]|nr:hypothetical protein [Candidatus Nomurabacteria bacterium]